MTNVRADLVALRARAAADERHIYEMGSDGLKTIRPAGDPERSLVLSRLTVWLLSNGFGADRVVINCGIETGGAARVPDLTVWAPGRPPRSAGSGYATTDGLMLTVDVATASSAITDVDSRAAEYALAGIPRYWLVRADGLVCRHTLTDSGEYGLVAAGPVPLDQLLAVPPEIL
ncbi:Uma2 family endonuclease [Actinoplanes sp. NPDC049596]|uniref:Uma2 family endonuclease n=1 Tax=unclassified Actinoplanes TaxID=2626549 RepID=UPI00341C6EBD